MFKGRFKKNKKGLGMVHAFQCRFDGGGTEVDAQHSSMAHLPSSFPSSVVVQVDPNGPKT